MAEMDAQGRSRARVHFVGGEKGGVGKSVTARLLAQYLIDGGIPFVGFDADRSHGTFSRFYSEFTEAVTVEEYESLDSVVEAAEAQPDREIVVDLAAQTASRLNQWMQDSEIPELLDELGFQVVLWHVMDDGADTIRLLENTLAQDFNQNFKLVIVQNLGRGKSFESFRKSETFEKAQRRGAEIMTLPKLHPPLMQKIDFANLSFWAAANNRDAASMTERRRVKVWLKNSYSEIERILGVGQQADAIN